jgi:DNA-binding MarR family transcriptional regulator
MKEPTSLNDNILYLIGEVARSAHRNVSLKFAEEKFGVTVEQFGVLAVLWYQEGVKQQEIALQLKRDKTTITRIIENMINKSLIVKIPDVLDRRNKLVYLTQKGKELQKEMVQSSGLVYYKALENIPDKDLEMCVKLLNKILNNLL